MCSVCVFCAQSACLCAGCQPRLNGTRQSNLLEADASKQVLLPFPHRILKRLILERSSFVGGGATHTLFFFLLSLCHGTAETCLEQPEIPSPANYIFIACMLRQRTNQIIKQCHHLFFVVLLVFLGMSRSSLFLTLFLSSCTTHLIFPSLCSTLNTPLNVYAQL